MMDDFVIFFVQLPDFVFRQLAAFSNTIKTDMNLVVTKAIHDHVQETIKKLPPKERQKIIDDILKQCERCECEEA